MTSWMSHGGSGGAGPTGGHTTLASHTNSAGSQGCSVVRVAPPPHAAGGARMGHGLETQQADGARALSPAASVTHLTNLETMSCMQWHDEASGAGRGERSSAGSLKPVTSVGGADETRQSSIVALEPPAAAERPLAACSLPCASQPCTSLPCASLPCVSLPCASMPCVSLPCASMPMAMAPADAPKPNSAAAQQQHIDALRQQMVQQIDVLRDQQLRHEQQLPAAAQAAQGACVSHAAQMQGWQPGVPPPASTDPYPYSKSADSSVNGGGVAAAAFGFATCVPQPDASSLAGTLQLDFYRWLLDVLPQPIFVRNSAGLLLYHNRALSDLVGQPADRKIEPWQVTPQALVSSFGAHVTSLRSGRFAAQTEGELDLPRGAVPHAGSPPSLPPPTPHHGVLLQDGAKQQQTLLSMHRTPFWLLDSNGATMQAAVMYVGRG